MLNKTTKTLISLAYLKTLWESRRQIIVDVYLPFLAEVFRKHNYTYVEDKDTEIIKLTQYVEEDFGINIPLHPMITLLNRAKKKGLLKKEKHKYIIQKDKLSNFEVDITNASRKVENLMRIVQEHVKKIFPDIAFSEEDIKEALLDFIDRFAYSLLLIEAKGKDREIFQSITKEKKKGLFIIGKVISEIHRSDVKGWELLQDIAVGKVLEKMLLYDPNMIKAKFKGLNVYLDTRIIFRILGVEGKEIKEEYIKFLNELKNQGVKLWIFRHTYEEILGILEGARKWIDNPGYDPAKASLALRHFKAIGWHQTDIDLIINKLEDEIRSYGIAIKYDNEEKDGAEIKKEIKNKIKETYEQNPSFFFYEKEYTIERDADSIFLIYRLRGNPSPVNLKQTNHLFITSNVGLSLAVGRFHKQKFKPQTICIPACVTDVFLGTFIWINNPVKIRDTLSASLISAALAFLKPTNEFIKKWHNAIQNLLQKGKINEEDFIILRDSQIARDLLDEETLGDPDQITPKTAEEILEKIKKEAYLLYEIEKKKHLETHEKLKEVEEVKSSLEDKISERSSQISSIIVAASAVAALILLFLTFISSGKVWKWVGGSLTAFFTILSLLGITTERFKRTIKNKIEKFLKGD